MFKKREGRRSGMKTSGIPSAVPSALQDRVDSFPRELTLGAISFRRFAAIVRNDAD